MQTELKCANYTCPLVDYLPAERCADARVGKVEGVGILCFNAWFFLFPATFQGPLFQQRPYPSPGAVLRRNAELAGQQGKPTGPNYAVIQKRGDGSDGLGDAD